MHTHPNARLTPLGRERLVRRHIDEHLPLAELAFQAGISLRAAYKWLARFRSGGPAALVDRRSVRRIQRRTLDPTTTPSSASAANVRSWAWPDPRSITGPRRCGHRPCGSWRGSMLCTWMIPAAAAAEWWTTWPEKGSRSAVTGCETSCAAWVYGRSISSHARRFPAIHRSDSPAWWTSDWSRLWIRSGPRTLPTSRCRRDSSTCWRSLICSRETSSVGISRTAWTQSSVCRHWRWHWEVGESQRSSIPIRAVNSLPVTSWPGCRQRGSRSAGQAESGATTTSWWRGCGVRSNTRRCTCMPTAMAGMQKSALPDSCD